MVGADGVIMHTERVPELLEKQNLRPVSYPLFLHLHICVVSEYPMPEARLPRNMTLGSLINRGKPTLALSAHTHWP